MTLQDNFIDPTDITNRALCAAFGYPKNGTDRLLERGKAGSVFWLECPDDLWAEVSAELTTAEINSVVTSKPASYVRDTDRNRHAPLAGRKNIIAITDSIGWNSPEGTAGTDSHVAQAVISAFGPLSPIWGGEPARETAGRTHTLLHHGNGGSRLGRTDGIDFGEEHNMQRPIKYDTLPLKAGDIIYIHLGANDIVAGAEAVDGAGLWTRMQTFLAGLKAAHPDVTLVVGTMIRRSEEALTNAKITAYNTLLRAGYAAEGVDALAELELAHADFSAASGDTTGAMYWDAAHPSTAGNIVLAATLAAILRTI